MAKATTVDDYAKGLGDWRSEVVTELAAIVRKAAPEAEAAIKWAQPVYSSNGPVCFIKAHAKHVNFGFWRGAELDDPKGLLAGDGEKMRHVKVESAEDVKKGAFASMVKQAVKLNAEKGNPTARKS